MGRKVYRKFELLTGDQDKELDALHICFESMRELSGEEIKRILEYLLSRHTYPRPPALL